MHLRYGKNRFQLGIKKIRVFYLPLGNVVILVTSDAIEHTLDDAVIHEVTEMSYVRPGKSPEIVHSDVPASHLLSWCSVLMPAT